MLGQCRGAGANQSVVVSAARSSQQRAPAAAGGAWVAFHGVCSVEGAAFPQRAGGGAQGEAEGLRGSCWAC